MGCARCGNPALIETKTMDEEGVLTVLRCLRCGHWQDELIEYHRSLPTPPEPRRPTMGSHDFPRVLRR